MFKKAIQLLEQLSEKLPDWHSECDCLSTGEMRGYEILIDEFLEEYHKLYTNPKTILKEEE